MKSGSKPIDDFIDVTVKLPTQLRDLEDHLLMKRFDEAEAVAHEMSNGLSHLLRWFSTEKSKQLASLRNEGPVSFYTPQVLPASDAASSEWPQLNKPNLS